MCLNREGDIGELTVVAGNLYVGEAETAAADSRGVGTARLW